MPSIPQSLLWISLVILWLFVLVPMLINKRDSVRRTSDVALATRVLNGGAAARLKKRSRPAAGHRGDPDWKPDIDTYDDLDEASDDEQPERSTRSVVVMSAVVEDKESEYLDVDIVDESSGALPAADAEPSTDVFEIPTETAEPTFDDVLAEQATTVEADPEVVVGEQVSAGDAVVEDEAADEEVAEDQDLADDGTADEYEYVDDTSGLEAGAEGPAAAATPDRERRRSNQTAAAAKVAARKYKFRKRVLVTLVLAIVSTAVGALVAMPGLWWACGAIAAITFMYLGYLRRQTRIEERLRRRRQQRMARARLGVENTRDAEMDVTPSRLRRPGAVVLEIDDEDPEFEHLDYVPFSREYDLPRASGQ